ncbi:thrombomodulin-like, partial [Columba livia]
MTDVAATPPPPQGSPNGTLRTTGTPRTTSILCTTGTPRTTGIPPTMRTPTGVTPPAPTAAGRHPAAAGLRPGPAGLQEEGGQEGEAAGQKRGGQLLLGARAAREPSGQRRAQV